MKDQLISFDTAKLAKEKGFNEPCTYYVFQNKGEKVIHQQDFAEDVYVNYFEDGQESHRITAPNQSLLQKWLRETHNICVTISGALNVKGYYYSVRKDYISISDGDVKYSTYEKALEAGLQEALKLI